jgi:hypothetical protein
MMTSTVFIPLKSLLIFQLFSSTSVTADGESVSCGAFSVCPAGCYYASFPLRFPNNTIECVTVGKGYYSASNDNFRHPCPAGKYSPITNSKHCVMCDKGSYAQGLANAACRLCPRGTYQDWYGQSYCETCDSDHLWPFPGSDSAFFAPSGTVYCDYGHWSLTRPPPPPPEAPLPFPSIPANPSTSTAPSVVPNAMPSVTLTPTCSNVPRMGPSPHPTSALTDSAEAEPSAEEGSKKVQIAAASIFALVALATLGWVLSSGRHACDCRVFGNQGQFRQDMSYVSEPRTNMSTDGVTGEEMDHANCDVEQGNTTSVSAGGVTGAGPKEALDNANLDVGQGNTSYSTDHHWVYQHDYRFDCPMSPVVEEGSVDNSESPCLEDDADADDNETSGQLS